jgi:hypothetical protein
LPNNANIVLIDRDFKFPQIWRTNIAFDKKLGNGWTATFEALYTKDINTVIMRNANQRATNGSLTGPDSRARFVNTADRRLYANIGTAIVLENNNRGNSGSLTFAINKNSAKGFSGGLAYTLSFANELTANPGAQATSTWNSNPTTNTQNSLEISNSAYVAPHRFIGNLSYKLEYAKYFATTFSLFGELAYGNNYSYVYNGDVNNDGNATTDLLYITRDVLFVNATASGVNPARTAGEQAAAWNEFINNTPYLRNKLNSYAGRNEAYLPLVSRVDFRVVQDLYVNVLKHKHTFQVTLDILNVGNMISKTAGVRQIVTQSNPLIFRGYDANGRPTFNMAQLNGQLVTKPWQNNLSLASTWSMQLGLRYIF